MPVNSDATTMMIKYNAPAVLALRRGDPSAIRFIIMLVLIFVPSMTGARSFVEYPSDGVRFVARSGRLSGSA
jgi:hypothetical protein